VKDFSTNSERFCPVPEKPWTWQVLKEFPKVLGRNNKTRGVGSGTARIEYYIYI